MAYGNASTYVGAPDLSDVSTRQKAPIGTIVKAVDSTYGEGEFIYLSIPTSTAIAAGTICYVNSSGNAVALPAVSTSKKTGRNVYVCRNAVSSDASNTQYTWFMKRGTIATLKTAVQVVPDSAVYISTTAGRFYLTASAGAQIVGARTVNAATVTTTTSTVLVKFDGAAVQGYS